MVWYLENPGEEEHGKDDDLTEEEEGEAVALGVQPDLDVRLKLKSRGSTTIAVTGTRVFALLLDRGTVVQIPVVLCCIDTISLMVSNLRPIPWIVVAHKVAIVNVIMSDQPVYWAHWFAKFVKVRILPSCFWHCYRNW